MRRAAITSAGTASDDCGNVKRAKCDALAQRLYFNKLVGLCEQYNANAYSMSELLEIISPTASIHFNFMVDISWLLEQYPIGSRNSPITLIVGERMGTDFTQLKNAVQKCGASNIRVGRARLTVPFGTHHSKISIFESGNGELLHIVISTANLLKTDWDYKTQAFFYCYGKKLTSDNFTENHSDFRKDLVEYMDEYKTSREWDLIEQWRNRVANTDLSHVKPRIVYSVPGTHKDSQAMRYGHPRLRTLLNELFGNTENDFVYHALFSSIGALGRTAQNWLTGQFLHSLAGGAATADHRLKIIYPCVEDVRNSNEGYEAGCSLPYSSYVAAKQQYLVKFMHKWRSDRLQRSQAIPHIKTYAAFARNSSKPTWLLITSANLSKAAWGDFQLRGSQLAVRSYEFGLLFTDPESLDMLPYDMPLTKYSDGDRPWIADLKYDKPDIFRKTWLMGSPWYFVRLAVLCSCEHRRASGCAFPAECNRSGIPSSLAVFSSLKLNRPKSFIPYTSSKQTVKLPTAFPVVIHMKKTNRFLLSFGDIVLYETDLKALENGEWLTDPVISFAFEYFYQRKLNDTDRSKMYFANAAVSQLIKLMNANDVTELLDQIMLKKKEYALFVVNDHDDPSCSGGSHWSLLIYRRGLHPHFLVVDSLAEKHSVNRLPTEKLIRTLARYFKLRSQESRFEKSTKQLNSVDCGMFVIEFSRLYVEGLKRGDVVVDFTQLNADMTKCRKTWGSIIRSMVNDG